MLDNPKVGGTAGRSALLLLSQASYDRRYGRMHAIKIRHVHVNLFIRKFARLYPNDDLTLANVERVAKDDGANPILVCAKVPKNAVLQAKYRQHSADNCAMEHDVKIMKTTALARSTSATNGFYNL
ncbi:hypothetical protein Thi970DRAFT_00005 [Thiorhodovibrio frisius]|uniref:Uncharacterized protein n=2 Tax=Thiorhodovibrio frisius TaxID=631362 RepID=H8YVD4_9GAMM|nr:hypothetical protein Thi970DRAFT_00005 [Thiorhodovibrio frisius]WPL23117.1 hypothetical protein Thiofri_03300 [Thiorhodovibrio frisius]